jgi:hypothetical protein
MAGENVLDSLRTTTRIERDGCAFYNAAAPKTKNSGAAKMSIALAREEEWVLVQKSTIQSPQRPESSSSGEGADQ